MIVTGSQIKAARQLLDWSQEKLARQAGVSASTVELIESGRRRPSILSALLEHALETAGIEFNSGDEPGAKVQKAK